MTEASNSVVIAASDLPDIYEADKTVMIVPLGTDMALIAAAVPIESVVVSGGAITVYVRKPEGDVRPFPYAPTDQMRVVYSLARR